jgi:DNA-binding NtrC family response regulator
VLAFDADIHSRHQATIRATAMVFEDPASRALQSDLDRLAPSEATILVNGETGTGKELIARYIHAHSKRAHGPFVAVNCGALSESLAEADLFGHEKGAFTGALNRQIGWFETANKGTLLLDEVGDLPLPLQVKLLRVLQEREVTRVGSRQSVPVDVRVIAATNVDLDDAISAKRFREDLYFRLTVACVRLPSLKDRPGDIGPLAQFFLELYRGRLGRRDLTFDPKALAELQRHGWPGNIRELENVVHNAVLLAPGQRILPQDLRFRRRCEISVEQPPTLESQLQAAVASAIVAGEEGVYDRALAAIVRAGFDLANGNQIRAAEMLGISRNTLRTQLSHLGIIVRRRRAKIVAEIGCEVSTLEAPPGRLSCGVKPIEEQTISAGDC